MLGQLRFTPSSSDPFLPAELTEAELYEFHLLNYTDQQWEKYAMMHLEDGRPLAMHDADGNLVINDPLLAQWDAEARANAAKLDAEAAASPPRR